MPADLLDILAKAVGHGATAVYVGAEMRPMVRVWGRLQPIGELPVSSRECAEALIFSILDDPQRCQFEQLRDLDFSYELQGLGRFRVNVFWATSGIQAVFRILNSAVPRPSDLLLPPAVIDLAMLRSGLVLVSGPTGSGKSATLAAIIDTINETREAHIVTIEDPIECVFTPKRCIVHQREVHTTTNSFRHAIRAALREDADVIMIGEMRDPETILLALIASEAGHLVLGTMYTADARQTVDRIIGAFPRRQRQFARLQLAATLRAVVCQNLIYTQEGRRRVAVREVMLVNEAIAEFIRERKTDLIPGAIEEGAYVGMTSFDRSLAMLVMDGQIDMTDALGMARNVGKLKAYLNQAETCDDRGSRKQHSSRIANWLSFGRK